MALIADRMSEANQKPAPAQGQGDAALSEERGIIAQAQNAQPTQEQNAGGMMQQETDGKPQPNVSPEEQSVYTAIVINAMKVIYGDQSQQIVDVLKKAGSPAEGVAQAANSLGDKIYKSAKKQGKEIPDDIMMAAAEEIVQMLFELGEKGGIFKAATDDEKFSAMTRLLQLWDESHPGMLDRESMQKSMAGIDNAALNDIMGRMGGNGGSDGISTS